MSSFQKFLDARYPGVGDFNEATSTASGARAEMKAAYEEGQLKGWMEAAEEKQRSERAGGGGSGLKVLKKGDAGHGSGKKRRRY